jgi:hypothetical protein
MLLMRVFPEFTVKVLPIKALLIIRVLYDRKYADKAKWESSETKRILISALCRALL